MSHSDPITDCRRSHFYVLLRVKSILSVRVISSDGMCSVSLSVSYLDEFAIVCEFWPSFELFQLIWIHVPLEAFFTITTYVVSYILKYIPCCIRTAVLMFWREYHKLIQRHTSFWIQGLLGGGSGAADWWKSWRNKVLWSMLALQILSESFHSLTSILIATLRSALAMRLCFSDSWTQTNSNFKIHCP